MTESKRRSSVSVIPWLVVGLFLFTMASVAFVFWWARPPRVAILLLVDKSASMAGYRIERIKDACLSVGEKLSPNDVMGVLAFDVKPRWVVSFSTVGDKTELRKGISCLSANGGTEIHPALVEALRAFETDSRADRALIKHILLLSDGKTSPGDFEGVVRTLANKGVTVSVVCLGTEDFNLELMTQIAEWGGGRFLFTGNSKKLPALFIQDTDQAIK